MIESGLDAAIGLIVSGPGSLPILHLLDIARAVTGAPIAYLVVLRDHEVQLVASQGIPITPFGSIARAEPGADLIFARPMLVDDLTKHPVLCSSPLVTRTGGFRWFAAIPIPLPSLQHRVALCCADPRVGVHRSSDLLERMEHIVLCIADALATLSVIGEQQHIINARRHPTPAAPNTGSVREVQTPFVVDGAAEPSAVTMRFLLSTLIGQRRMLERDGVSYHALTRWRAAIKPWQIDALRALKVDPPAALIDCVANELATAAVDFHGAGSFDVVVPVACGNSGEMCLAYSLAQAVAGRLRIAFTPSFDRIETVGSSHPRRNSTRPRMKLRVAPTQRVLLIDDVATSGSHIVEATKLLRATAQIVVPLVWIAAR